MIRDLPSSVPEPHRQFLRQLLERLKTDARIVGIAAGGSYLTNSMDEFSDLDLVIAVDPQENASVIADRHAIAASLGNLLAAFTGEHVGEPRLLICLYDAPILHVDLKFVSLEDVGQRVEEPAVLWERDGRLSGALSVSEAEYPVPDPRWIDERFWVWVHYGATKIGRGELFEALDFLSFLRAHVLGPLGLYRAGVQPAGVRKLEMAAPAFARELRRTVAGHDAHECLRALRACVELYRTVHPDANREDFGGEPERATMEYLSEVEQRCGPTPR